MLFRSARIAHEVLVGSPSALRDIIMVNAGCAIYTADCAATIKEGMAKARDAIDGGRARMLLDRVVELTR